MEMKEIKMTSGKMIAVETAIGFGAGLFMIKYTPQVLGTWTNLAVGIVSIVIAVLVKHKDIGAFLIGFGAAYILDGSINVYNDWTKNKVPQYNLAYM